MTNRQRDTVSKPAHIGVSRSSSLEVVKVAAYQAPLGVDSPKQAVELICEQVRSCELLGVDILCCPEGVLGGLADYASQPGDIAIDVQGGELATVLAPLGSATVTTILGFTELGSGGRLFNSAAILHKGLVVGIYRKLRPAINRSIYEPGRDTPVFTVGGVTFGIVICRDSAFSEPAQVMIDKGATVLFVPTNNGMPPAKGGPELVEEARSCDIARAMKNGVSVIRADVAGRADGFVSYGSSGIIDRQGKVLVSAKPLEADLIVAAIEITCGRV